MILIFFLQNLISNFFKVPFYFISFPILLTEKLQKKKKVQGIQSWQPRSQHDK